MKKKGIIVSIIVLILLILLIPRPRYLNDGGTVEYKALEKFAKWFEKNN